ncbi:6157_t:CDS:2 [Diversispora eburnea]|uniref:6157_t:CDS:1 n=1 Tax=Diversispora eburnea TaxID=1213867 RepID=A0A9N9FUB7_9GLOM|nr:6157_t:CDS:2 [Diversispora eburnea]
MTSNSTLAANGEVEPINDEILDEMKSIDKEFELAELELARQKVKLYAPICEKRRKIIERIPKFWTNVFLRHRIIAQYLDYEDYELIVERDEENVENFKIIVKFSKNSYFTNTDITKEFSVDGNGIKCIKTSEVNWYEGKDFTKKRKNYETDPSLIKWLTENVTDDVSWELGKVIRDDLYFHAWMHYNEDIDDDEGDIGDLEDDIEEGEEEDEADLENYLANFDAEEFGQPPSSKRAKTE